MSTVFIPMPESDRQTIRRRVIEWARLQPAVPELSIGLLEGPGGEGADLIFFTHDGGSLIYLTSEGGDQIPHDYADWIQRWKQAGAPAMNIVAVEGEDEARTVLLEQLQLFSLAMPAQTVH